LVNRFDNPAEYKPINTHVSEFVEMPFQEINAVLASRQKKADDQKADIAAKASSLNIPTIREHESARKEFVDQYNQKFMKLLDSGIDPTSGEFVRKKKEILDELASDYRPGAFKRSVDAYKQQQDYTEKLRADSKYGYYNDPYARGFQGVDETGRVNEYQFKAFNPSEDRVKPIYDHFDNAKPSGSEAEGFQLDKSGNIIGVKQGYEGIGQQFINRNTEKFVDPFLNSNAGRDLVSEIRFNNPDATPQEIRQYAKDHIKDLASVYMFNKSSQGTDFKYAPEYVSGGLAEDQFNTQAPITHNPATANPFQGQELIVDANGNLGGTRKYFHYGKEISERDYKDLSKAGNYGATQGLSIEETTPEQLEVQNKQLTDLRTKYKEVYGEEIDNKQAAELYNKAIKNTGSYVPRDKNFSAGKSDIISKQVLGGTNTIQGLLGKPLELLGPDGGKQINSNELEELIGKEGVKTARVQGRNLDHPTKPGGYVVSISTKDGKNIKVAVGADEVTEGWFTQNVSPATQANLSGKDTQWKVGRNLFKTVTVPKKDGSGFATKVITLSPSGTYETDYNDWVKAQHNVYDEKFKHLYTAGYNTTTENKKLDTEEE
jgi:hypothetical protein